MRSRRGRERRLVQPGQLVAWDPSTPTPARAVDGRPWSSRLMVVEVADLAALAGDEESDLAGRRRVSRAGRSPTRTRRHASCGCTPPSTRRVTRLERDERLAEWLRALIERSSAVAPAALAAQPRDDRALRLAFDYLADRPSATSASMSSPPSPASGSSASSASSASAPACHPTRYRSPTASAPPAACSRPANTIADTAAATGFADQSHLHRHFQRSLGLTPGEYRRRLPAPADTLGCVPCSPWSASRFPNGYRDGSDPRTRRHLGAPVWQPVGGRMWSNSSGAARVLARPGLTRRSHVEG